jgi:hypothetical protein
MLTDKTRQRIDFDLSKKIKETAWGSVRDDIAKKLAETRSVNLVLSYKLQRTEVDEAIEYAWNLADRIIYDRTHTTTNPESPKMPMPSEISSKVTELGGILYINMYQEAIFKKDDRASAEKFAEWIRSKGAYNIQFNPYDYSYRKDLGPGLAVLFDF